MCMQAGSLALATINVYILVYNLFIITCCEMPGYQMLVSAIRYVETYVRMYKDKL